MPKIKFKKRENINQQPHGLQEKKTGDWTFWSTPGKSWIILPEYVPKSQTIFMNRPKYTLI